LLEKETRIRDDRGSSASPETRALDPRRSRLQFNESRRVVAKGGGGAHTTEIKGVVMVAGECRRIR
jgi:hypothetical protein